MPYSVIRDTHLYPCTIVAQRYGSGYFAFNTDFFELDERMLGDDMSFWDWEAETKDALKGIGGTPDEAYYDLVEKLFKEQQRCSHANARDFTAWSYCDDCEAKLEKI